jgi:Uma2 family endonuclease
MAALAESCEVELLSLAGLTMPVTLRPAKPLTDQELIAFSRRNRPYRIEQNAKGELEIMSPAGSKGANREAYVIRALGIWTEQNGGMDFSSNGGFTLPDNALRSPDASWIAQTRWDALPEIDQEGYASACPDFLVEILSKTDSRTMLEEKMEMWIANGARLAWMIDPFAAEIIIYRPEKASERLMRPDWIEADEVVPGFRLETSRLWAK